METERLAITEKMVLWLFHGKLAKSILDADFTPSFT